ncbi:MAG: prepilin-type N-terminal cleavage/methylation domain-containing protein [Luteolibacter sp.]
MTCLHRASRNSREGFTLLEIVIVLLLAGIIVGGVIGTLYHTDSERNLRDASGEIELLAKKAHTAALLHQHPYAIEFLENSIRLRPFSETLDTNLIETIDFATRSDDDDEQQTAPAAREEIEIDPDITLTIRHWNSEPFIKPNDTNTPVWRFDPDGLAEPLTVRLTIGESYSQDTYHPLTGTIADKEMSIVE